MNIVRRIALGPLLAMSSLVSACQSWHVEKRPVEAVITSHSDGPVAVTMNDLRWVVLDDPRVVRDSIIGIRTAGNTFGKGRTALSLSGVRTVETRRFSFLRTFYLAAFAAALPSIYRFAVVDNE